VEYSVLVALRFAEFIKELPCVTPGVDHDQTLAVRGLEDFGGEV
jgi:hypothetical protein